MNTAPRRASLLLLLLPLSAHALLVAPTSLALASTLSGVSQHMGESALRQVQWMGSIVAQKEQEAIKKPSRRAKDKAKDKAKVDGTGGGIYTQVKGELLDVIRPPPKEKQVWEALANLEQDSTFMIVFVDFVLRPTDLSPLLFCDSATA